MGFKGSRFISLIVTILILTMLCCGEGSKKEEEKKDSKEDFRIPDSLLAPIEGYRLVRDEYDPVTGGVMASAEIELCYPASIIARYVAVRSFGFARSGYRKVVGEVGKPAEGRIVIIGAKDLDEYEFLTRKKWWYYGYIRGDTIYFEPLDIMLKRHIAEIGITQKIAQMALRRRSGGRIPLWLREAVASYIAGERKILQEQANEFRSEFRNLNPPPGTIETDLAEAYERSSTRIAFFAAYRMLENLLGFSSMDDILSFLDRLRAGESLDEASNEVFGMDYSALLDRIRVDGK